MAWVTSAPILPATVAAAHLESCAAELAGARLAGLDDVSAIVPVLTRAQRQLAVALGNLARHTDGGRPRGARDAGDSAESAALAEVLRAASDAAHATANALGESLPLLENLADGDTRS
ncbi:hypothetical protein ACFFS4_22810 [Kutzneria kofuensis]|uniref:Uncharacterized protein n=1 Tax=Kutzneria kofuensis TaxID=103725 RepID=A0A7W9NIT2_9PSEU|nr:hypothetical protein [Kutzneria kofuensis]MBB5893904.1 hypothetical protein [Kutzneria kofuensis]